MLEFFPSITFGSRSGLGSGRQGQFLFRYVTQLDTHTKTQQTFCKRSLRREIARILAAKRKTKRRTPRALTRRVGGGCDGVSHSDLSDAFDSWGDNLRSMKPHQVRRKLVKSYIFDFVAVHLVPTCRVCGPSSCTLVFSILA